MLSKQKLAIAGAGLVLVGGAVAVLASGGDEPPATTTTTASTTTTAAPTTTTTVPLELAPLTGIGMVEVPDRPALVVKIDNADPAARPQSGLAAADVVYEERVEGGVTRFAAVFHSTDADPVGPIRSGRTTDIGLTANLHDPLFAFSGANSGILRSLRQSAIVDVGYDAATSAYVRRSDRRAPDNLYSTTAQLWAAAPDAAGRPEPMFTYRAPGDPAPAGAQPVGAVRIGFTGAASVPVEYRWDPEGGAWLRFQRGTPHVGEDDEQLAPENVIVQEVDYVSTGYYDVAGNPVPEAVVYGIGTGWVFVDGQVIEARWGRDGPDATTVWQDVDGNPIALVPGRTWIHLAPPGNVTLDP